MIIYHFYWDLGYFGFIDLRVVTQGLGLFFAQLIGLSFITISGISSRLLSLSNSYKSKIVRRILRLISISIAISILTFILDKSKSAHLLRGYQSVRKLNYKEKSNFNTLCRGSALRYLLTRSYDYLNTPKKALIKIKDPKEYLDKLNFHRKLNSFKDYS